VRREILVLSGGGAVIRKLALLVWKEEAGEDLTEYALLKAAGSPAG